jgi:hypothetical protein
MPLSENINNREFNKFTRQRGTRVKTQSVPEDGNAFQVETTEITTDATPIDTPEDANKMHLIHVESGVIIYLGGSDVTTSNGWPLVENTPLHVDLKKGNNNSIYGIVASGTADIKALGVVKE